MTFDWSEPGKVKIGMTDYVSSMVDDFSVPLKPTDTAPNPAAENLFAPGTSDKLDKVRAKEFHTFGYLRANEPDLTFTPRLQP